MVCYHVMNNSVAKGLLLWKNHVSKKKESEKSRYKVNEDWIKLFKRMENVWRALTRNLYLGESPWSRWKGGWECCRRYLERIQAKRYLGSLTSDLPSKCFHSSLFLHSFSWKKLNLIIHENSSKHRKSNRNFQFHSICSLHLKRY